MRQPKVEVVERDVEYEQPVLVKVSWSGVGAVEHEMWIGVGDVFWRRLSERRRRMEVTVTGFFSDGTKAFVDRSTSRRKQAISVANLARGFERGARGPHRGPSA